MEDTRSQSTRERHLYGMLDVSRLGGQVTRELTERMSHNCHSAGTVFAKSGLYGTQNRRSRSVGIVQARSDHGGQGTLADLA